MKIYLAGPLFTIAEKAFNSQLAELLQAGGHQVWLPQEHEPREKGGKAMFEMDVKGIDQSDVVVANMDGPDPDSGTCWECGYAFRKKPVVVFRSDIRSGDAPDIGRFNLMLVHSADVCLDEHLDALETLSAALLKALRTLPDRKA
jgi:nucleoside 2-deoxyribosyltransferase